MRIVCISDTHNHDLTKLDLPAGDILLHAGDWTGNGNVIEVSRFNEYCKKIKYKYTYGIYTCGGNHDFLAEENTGLCKSILTNCHLLINESIEIEGIKFYFSPYSPFFYNWAFNLAEDGSQAQSMWAKIPDNTNILITHGPPRTILDTLITTYEHVGCPKLTNRVLDLQELKLHIFGHIHYSYGYEQHGSKHFINASICNEQYNPVNKPYIVDINTLTKHISSVN